MKYNRNIDEHKIQQAKSRTIHTVMDQIEAKRNITSIFSQVKFKFVISILSFVFMIVIGLVIFRDNSDIGPIVGTSSVIELSQTDQQKIAEVSYLSSNIIVNALGSSIQQLSLDTSPTKFKDKAEEFDYYFQMIKPLMDKDTIDIEVINLENLSYNYRMTYLINNEIYTFDFSMNQNTIQGEMRFKGLVLSVGGEIEVNKENIDIEIIAKSGNDYIKLVYESEVDKDEIEKEYLIEEYINGVFKKREINMSFEDDEASVELKEFINGTENIFELTRENDNQSLLYNFEYEIDGVKGQGYISYNVGSSPGQSTYSYHIEEDGQEEDYDFDDEDDDDDEDEDDEAETES